MGSKQQHEDYPDVSRHHSLSVSDLLSEPAGPSQPPSSRAPSPQARLSTGAVAADSAAQGARQSSMTISSPSKEYAGSGPESAEGLKSTGRRGSLVGPEGGHADTGVTSQFAPVQQMLEHRDCIEYQLTIREQPKHSRMCGVGEKADRRPIDPAPIIQLRVITHDRPAGSSHSQSGQGSGSRSQEATQSSGVVSSSSLPSPTMVGGIRRGIPVTTAWGPGWEDKAWYLENPYYFVYAMLADAETDEELHLLQDGKTRYTTGSCVSCLYHLKDIDGSHQGFFVFPDLSIRVEGKYRLKLCLFETIGHEVHHCKSIYSAPFSVYTAKRFPGMEETTRLSKSFADQGLKVRVRKNPRIRRRSTKRKEGSGSDESDADDGAISSTTASRRDQKRRRSDPRTYDPRRDEQPPVSSWQGAPSDRKGKEREYGLMPPPLPQRPPSQPETPPAAYYSPYAGTARTSAQKPGVFRYGEVEGPGPGRAEIPPYQRPGSGPLPYAREAMHGVSPAHLRPSTSYQSDEDAALRARERERVPAYYPHETLPSPGSGPFPETGQSRGPLANQPPYPPPARVGPPAHQEGWQRGSPYVPPSPPTSQEPPYYPNPSAARLPYPESYRSGSQSSRPPTPSSAPYASYTPGPPGHAVPPAPSQYDMLTSGGSSAGTYGHSSPSLGEPDPRAPPPASIAHDGGRQTWHDVESQTQLSTASRLQAQAQAQAQGQGQPQASPRDARAPAPAPLPLETPPQRLPPPSTAWRRKHSTSDPVSASRDAPEQTPTLSAPQGRHDYDLDDRPTLPPLRNVSGIPSLPPFAEHRGGGTIGAGVGPGAGGGSLPFVARSGGTQSPGPGMYHHPSHPPPGMQPQADPHAHAHQPDPPERDRDRDRGEDRFRNLVPPTAQRQGQVPSQAQGQRQAPGQGPESPRYDSPVSHRSQRELERDRARAERAERSEREPPPRSAGRR